MIVEFFLRELLPIIDLSVFFGRTLPKFGNFGKVLIINELRNMKFIKKNIFFLTKLFINEQKAVNAP